MSRYDVILSALGHVIFFGLLSLFSSYQRLGTPLTIDLTNEGPSATYSIHQSSSTHSQKPVAIRPTKFAPQKPLDSIEPLLEFDATTNQDYSSENNSNSSTMNSAQQSQSQILGNGGSGAGIIAPRVIKEKKALFPLEAKKNKVSGTVLLTIVIAEDGTVTNVKVKKPSGTNFGFEENAVAALYSYRFSPAKKEGKPISVIIDYRYIFDLK